MKKTCPKCGNHLPDEASFCLNCFYSLDAVVESDGKKRKKPLGFILWFKLHRKKLLKYSIAALSFLIVMGICISALKTGNDSPSPKTPDTTVIVEETRYVPVTEAGGVAVTDEDGEQVTDVVEVTKIETLPASTTQKQGLLDKIFNSDTKKNTETKNDKTTDNKTTETTEKKGFFDQIIDSVFGTDEEESTSEPATSTHTTEEHGTTQNTTAPSSTTTKPVTTTEKVTQTTSSTVGTTAVTTTESGNYYFEYEAQSASNPNGAIELTKYVGNASIVTVPSIIDGRKVAAIESDCFINNSKITEIHFDDTNTSVVIYLYRHCFNNLSSLNKIVRNNKSIDISGSFAYNCPITYIGQNGSTDNKLVDGAYYKGSVFYWFTAHPSYTTLTFPDWCTKIDNSSNLGEVTNLKVLNIHNNVSNIQTSPWDYGKGLKEINVEEGHPTVFSHDGVLFYKRLPSDKTYECIYPYCKTDKTFKLPEGCYLSIGTGSSFTTNPHLEEVWLPLTSYLWSPDSKYFYETCYPNLKTIHIAEGHSQYDKIAKTFKGTLVVY